MSNFAEAAKQFTDPDKIIITISMLKKKFIFLFI